MVQISSDTSQVAEGRALGGLQQTRAWSFQVSSGSIAVSLMALVGVGLTSACLVWLIVEVGYADSSLGSASSVVPYDDLRYSPPCSTDVHSGDYLHLGLGYAACFDGPGDNGIDEQEGGLGVSHWVSQEIRDRRPGAESSRRPSRWLLPKELKGKPFAPTDDSYRGQVDNGGGTYDRGHLAQKYLLERIGLTAAWESHNLVNAVPQLHVFNAGIWLDLERRTGAWANQLDGHAWVIDGPVFYGAHVQHWLRAGSYKSIAIPDALFKIVVRERAAPVGAIVPSLPPVEAIAFVFPQSDPSYAHRRDWRMEKWLVSISTIEAETGLKFDRLDGT